MTFLELKKYFLFLHYSLTNYTPDFPISKHEPYIAKVLSDTKLIDKKLQSSSTIREEMPKDLF